MRPPFRLNLAWVSTSAQRVPRMGVLLPAGDNGPELLKEHFRLSKRFAEAAKERVPPRLSAVSLHPLAASPHPDLGDNCPVVGGMVSELAWACYPQPLPGAWCRQKVVGFGRHPTSQAELPPCPAPLNSSGSGAGKRPCHAGDAPRITLLRAIISSLVSRGASKLIFKSPSSMNSNPFGQAAWAARTSLRAAWVSSEGGM